MYATSAKFHKTMNFVERTYTNIQFELINIHNYKHDANDAVI